MTSLEKMQAAVKDAVENFYMETGVKAEKILIRWELTNKKWSVSRVPIKLEESLV
jgi:glutamate synthase domain-containing protein 3